MPRFEASTTLEVPTATAFAWHARKGAFERLIPPWMRVRLIERHGSIQDGDRLVMELSLGLIKRRWVAEHRDYQANRQFRDLQLEGPFAAWDHLHAFTPQGDHRCVLKDEIMYRVPFASLGQTVMGPTIARELTRMFGFRHERTRHDLARHEAFAQLGPQRIAITGASGFVSTQLAAFLTSGGHDVRPLVRRTAGEREIHWNPATGALDLDKLEGVDAVIHLAGESIAGGRWTPERKAAIRDSRVQGTRLLAEGLAKLRRPPRVLVCASAIGFYGDRGEEVLTEASKPGTGFLSEVCQAWEAAADPAREAGIRVVHLRTGIVLSPGGGALAQMLLPFVMGVGGVIGSGRQWMSWIGFDDLIGAFHHALFTESLEGPVNATAPQPVTNAAFTRTLGKVLGRPTLFPLPAPVVRLVFGELGDALLLEGARVQPTKLEASGFKFHHPDLEAALRSELGR
ncbi:TIGR01777 family oxidoreductase [bacterium]|nr:TIGR01777 family oxidoreductase [bacterium]